MSQQSSDPTIYDGLMFVSLGAVIIGIVFLVSVAERLRLVKRRLGAICTRECRLLQRGCDFIVNQIYDHRHTSPKRQRVGCESPATHSLAASSSYKTQPEKTKTKARCCCRCSDITGLLVFLRP
jgi:hypothetical protein